MEIFAEHGWLGLHVAAVLVTAIAAYTDVRTGLIPNWLTFPVILTAPIVHGVAFGLTTPSLQLGLLPSLMGVILCGAIPAFLFYQMVKTDDGEEMNAMGGGDVKLFAAVGGLVGPLLGVIAEVYVMAASGIMALVWVVLRGGLPRLLRNYGTTFGNLFRPKDKRIEVTSDPNHNIRLGPAFLLGTAVVLLQHDWPLLVHYFG